MTLDQDEIHLWFCHDEKIVDNALLQQYYDTLNEPEKEKTNRFQFEKDRNQYLITRALLRHALSLYVNEIAPEQWEFISNEHGKPSISDPLPQPLQFNLSHTDGMIVLAITRNKEIGIDVESQLKRRKSLEVADRFFSPPEIADLKSLPKAQQVDRFYDLWTLKEAYLKARGLGLSTGLDKFSFQFPNDKDITITFNSEMADDPKAWKFWLFKTNEERTVALAAKSSNPQKSFAILIREMIPKKDHIPVSWSCLRSS